MRLALALIAILATACATQQATTPALTPPAAVTPAVLDALCGRLRIDAIASTAPLAIVSVTRPLATQQSMSALALLAPGRIKTNRVGESASEANRALPVVVESGQCTWRAVAPAQLDRHFDELMVELSAPAINPFMPKQGGLFARVTVGGEGASWYWVSLFPRGDQWAVGGVSVLSQ
ncbi:MAG TPA: hypothetical protein VND45_05485 [Thermoanaerobaculia bacterium]|jgi:hypothetical protein|nr:hypothetical protein [Thermoanaerobaculia bacterium]